MSRFPCSTSPGLLLYSPSPSQPGSRLTHSGDGSAVGHKTKAVLENSMAIEEWDGATSDLVKLVLKPLQPGTRRVLNLVIYVILPKREDQHQSCPRERQERGHVEGQKATSWSPSPMKGPSEQDLEERIEPWDKSRRPEGSPRPAWPCFVTVSRTWPVSWQLYGSCNMTGSPERCRESS